MRRARTKPEGILIRDRVWIGSPTRTGSVVRFAVAQRNGDYRAEAREGDVWILIRLDKRTLEEIRAPGRRRT